MRLIRWFRSAWADANKSGEWMADAAAFHSLSRWGRWAIRTQPRWDMLSALAFLVIPVLITTLLLVVLVVLLIEALM